MPAFHAELTWHYVDCGSGSIRLRIAGIGDPELTEDTDPDRIPYWSTLWPSAGALAGWIVEQGGWSGREVLELGCGTGLVGIAAALAGATVVQTDLFPEAVALARSNSLANGAGGIRQVAADWHQWPFRARWPVIIAADVAYERTSHAALLSVLETALSPSGIALLADPERRMSRSFFEKAEAAGWSVTRQPLAAEGVPIGLYRLQRSGKWRPHRNPCCPLALRPASARGPNRRA